MKILQDRRYSEEHEWARPDPDDDNLVIVGITDFAQAQLGDVVMVELPDVGDELTQGETCGAVESPKSVSDLFAPVSGEVVEINEALLEEPELVNESCYEAGWFFKVRLTDRADYGAMLDAAAYAALVDGL
jgi:glycine cleavage system H protein